MAQDYSVSRFMPLLRNLSLKVASDSTPLLYDPADQFLPPFYFALDKGGLGNYGRLIFVNSSALSKVLFILLG
jgi:hypothetical protein